MCYILLLHILTIATQYIAMKAEYLHVKTYHFKERK